MSKELLRPQQFGKAVGLWSDDSFQLSPQQKAELEALYGGPLSQFKTGTVISGRVIGINADGVLVDISYKSNGLIPLHEFSEHELKRFVAGSDIEVIIDEAEDMGGNVVLSYEKAKTLKAWDAILKLYHENKPVEGVVTHKVKGGLSVDIGIAAFLPGSQVDLQRVADFDQYVGQTIAAYIIKVNPKRGNVIISRRKYLHEQRSEVRKKVLDVLEAGQVIQGVVKNITNYGVFVDVGGVDGLLHITDMTWGRIAHPTEVLKIGDTVTVKVLSCDRDNEKISLGMKQLTENPWDQAVQGIAQGSRVKGRISSITDYGLFVEIAKGVEGLVHISEISWTDRIADLHKHYKVGDEIEALVVSIDRENRRMSLSVKQLENNPWDVIESQFKIGQHIKGKISNITDFGLFIQLMPGVDGLVHISDISWTEHVKHPADIYSKGDEVEAVIIDINTQKKKISLGIKQLTANPWDSVATTYPVGSLVDGEVTKITDFGAFVKLSNGIEGLIHISELGGNERAAHEAVKVGQKIAARVAKVSAEDQRIGLTLGEETARRSTGSSGRSQQRRSGGEAGGSRRTTEYTASGATKAKSQLQIELERIANRSGSNDEEAE